jgi:acyl-CoA synthetase (AMP-forming)/AMP-acid ligase II
VGVAGPGYDGRVQLLISDLVHRAAWRFGDAPAIVEGERTLTFTELDTRSNRLANALVDLGLRPGDRVATLLPNCIEHLLAYCALPRAGLVRVSLNARDSAETHAFKIDDSGARALIGDLAAPAPSVEFHLSLEQVDEFSASGRNTLCDVPTGRDAPYRLGYTGGTTGRPKGVILTDRVLQTQLYNMLTEHIPGIRPGDVMLHTAPMSHASGSYFLPNLVCGGVNVILARYRPTEFLEQLERTRARRTFLVPTMMAALLEEPNIDDVDASDLRQLCYAASPIAPSVVERCQRVFGEVLCQTYGQTEAPMTITLLRPDEHRLVGSAGRPYLTSRVRIVDEENTEVSAGAIGEIVVRGPVVAAGYWNRGEDNDETFRDGWLHTRDIGYQDDGGYVYLLDRRNDVIISGGFNIYPREVEDALTAHPAIGEAVVVSIADDRWGEIVQAVVTLHSPLSVTALDEYMKAKVAGYKRPRGYHVWESLPKSAAGKLMRRTVRDQLRADSAARTSGSRPSATLGDRDER